MDDGAYRLVLLRHGESEWNAAGLFTGWADPGLTPEGERQAVHAGHMLAGQQLFPDVAHTSVQRRAIRTGNLALAAADREWIPVRRSWRLNGRHYGALQGLAKVKARADFGPEQVRLWRRSWDAAPRPAEAGVQRELLADPRYALLAPQALPRSESLRDVTLRLLPYWYDAIVPDLRTGGVVLVVSHGNTLRALVAHLEQIPAEKIPDLEICNGIPLVYHLDPSSLRCGPIG